MKKEKRLSRCTALQVLYCYELVETSTKEIMNYIIQEFKEETYSSKVKKYVQILVNQTIQNNSFLNEIVSNKSNNWEMNRIAIIDNIILRMAIAEMLFLEDIPLKVSIAEAIEIAKIFSTNDSGRDNASGTCHFFGGDTFVFGSRNAPDGAVPWASNFKWF